MQGKKQKKGQQTMNSLGKLYRKRVRHNLIDKKDFEAFCSDFTKYANETKKSSLFKKMNKKF